MVRLVDCCSLSDDNLSEEAGLWKLEGRKPSETQHTKNAASAITPMKKHLVLKAVTPKVPTHKIRRLRSSKQETNLLFQPWSRQDGDGFQALPQKTMRESPAKLGLFTEFEQDKTSASRTKSSNRNRYETKCQTFTNDFEEHAWDFPSIQGQETRSLVSRTIPVEGIDYGKSSILNCHVSSIPQDINDATPKTLARQSIFQERDLVVDFPTEETYAHKSTSKIFPSPDTTTISTDLLRDDMDRKHRSLPRTLPLSKLSTCLDSGGAGQKGPASSIDGSILNLQSISHNFQDSLTNTTIASMKGSNVLHHEDDDLWGIFEKMHLTSTRQSDGGFANGAEKTSVTLSGHQTTTLSPPEMLQLKQTLAQDPVDRRNSPQSVQVSLLALSPTDQQQITGKRLAKKKFQAAKQSLARDFFDELDEKVANGRIMELTKTTGGVKLTWTKSLNTTAGRAHWRRETLRSKTLDEKVRNEEHQHHASIDLAEKVIDDENKLLNVLAHEFCHLATFMISGTTTNPHGKDFKVWASKCSHAFRDRGIHVTTRHSYDIDFKYVWQCVSCRLEYKRHSRSIDIQRHRCGSCKSELEQTRPASRGGSKNGNDVLMRSHYQLFVRDQMPLVKMENPHVLQRELMKIIAAKWAAQKTYDITSSQVHTPSMSG